MGSIKKETGDGKQGTGKGKRERGNGKGEKILVVQTAYLGDVILSTPFFRALGVVFPNAQVDVVTTPSTQVLLKHHPGIRRIWTLDKSNLFRKGVDFFRLVHAFRKEKYDLAFSLQLHLTSSLLLLASGIPVRVGFRRQKLLTLPIQLPKGLPVRERYLYLLSPWQDSGLDSGTELFWSSAEEDKASQIISQFHPSGRFLVGIAPGSIWPTKRWPMEYYQRLVEKLTRHGIDVFLFGGAEDVSLCETVKGESGAVNLAGKLSVLESAAVIQKCNLFISNDSAPMHMANAVKTPVIAIFGPTVRQFGCYPFGPHDEVLEVDLPCRPCSKHGTKRCPQGHFRCMREILPETVFEKVLAHLEKKK